MIIIKVRITAVQADGYFSVSSFLVFFFHCFFEKERQSFEFHSRKTVEITAFGDDRDEDAEDCRMQLENKRASFS